MWLVRNCTGLPSKAVPAVVAGLPSLVESKKIHVVGNVGMRAVGNFGTSIKKVACVQPSQDDLPFYFLPPLNVLPSDDVDTNVHFWVVTDFNIESLLMR